MYFTKTLNLPKTNFPMKANLSTTELDILLFWDSLKLYDCLFKQRYFFSKFILIDGPPYANGNIHLGHGLNKVLKDFILRSKLLDGYCVIFIPGWDCHGLPIELNVEKEIGKPNTDLEKNIFRKTCRYYAAQQIEKQKNDFIRLGIFANWNNYYTTMDFSFEANIIRLFGKIFFNNNFVQSKRPVYWCTECASSLAEAEVIHKQKYSLSIYVLFAIVITKKFLEFFKNFFFKKFEKFLFYVIIWTTTPWTLLFNKAVALNEKENYTFLLYNNIIYIVSEQTIDKFLNLFSKEKIFSNLFTVTGKNLLNFSLTEPIYNKIVPLIHSDHVSAISGTGFVHIAPSFGYEDYLLSLKYTFQISCNDTTINEKGIYIGKDPKFIDKNINELSFTIINFLELNKTLLFKLEISHSYPYCWRHKYPLIFRSTEQWFISMTKNNLLKNSLYNLNTIFCTKPNWSYNYFHNMLKKRPDWCISRQRVWGIPLPICIDNNAKIHPQILDIINAIASVVEEKGVEGWYNLCKDKFLIENNFTTVKNQAKNYTFLSDVLDVWFDSAAVNFCLQENKNYNIPHQADLYFEGFDQYRGWFQSALLVSAAAGNVAPFKELISHGFVVDNTGLKLSKSTTTNVNVTPNAITSLYGADIFRLWVASVDFTGNITFSSVILDRLCDTYRKIRNTLRFLLSNCNILTINNFSILNLLQIDLFMINYTFLYKEYCIKLYKRYDYNLIFQSLRYFCTNILSTYYFDIVKDRLYTSSKYSNARNSALFTIEIIFNVLVHIIAPILSFTAEEAWQKFIPKKEKSIFQSRWPNNILEKYYKKELCFLYLDQWDFLYNFRSFVLKYLDYFLRIKKISSISQLELYIICNDLFFYKLNEFNDELHYYIGVSKLKLILDKKVKSNIFFKNIKNFIILPKKTNNFKCMRCWLFSVSQLFLNIVLCNKCIHILKLSEESTTNWEKRLFF